MQPDHRSPSPVSGRIPDGPPNPDGTLVAVLSRNAEEQLRIQINVFVPPGETEGRPYVDVRNWYLDRTGGGWRPGNKGLSVKLRHAREVSEAMARIADWFDESRDDSASTHSSRPADAGRRQEPNKARSSGQIPPPEMAPSAAFPPKVDRSGQGSRRNFDEFG